MSRNPFYLAASASCGGRGVGAGWFVSGHSPELVFTGIALRPADRRIAAFQSS